MFDYPYLEVLRAVEREANLERAAKSHKVTKSALSQTLATLDYRMGAVTLDRKLMRPTRFGARLCRHLEEVGLLEQAFFSSQVNLLQVPAAMPVTLQVGVLDDAHACWLADIVCQSLPPTPKLLLDMELVDVDGVAAAQVENRLCAALTSSIQIKPGFGAHQLGAHFMHAVASPQVAARFAKGGTGPDKFAKTPLLRYGPDDVWPDRWLSLAFGEAQPVSTHILPSAQGIANACEAGVGWGMCSSLLVSDELKSGALVELVPGSGLQQSIVWHVSDHVADALLPVTEALLATARRDLMPLPGSQSQSCVSLTAV